MALGPLLSFPLQHLGDSVWYGVRINPITAAAILMAAAWLAFGIVCEFFFEDPLQCAPSSLPFVRIQTASQLRTRVWVGSLELRVASAEHCALKLIFWARVQTGEASSLSQPLLGHERKLDGAISRMEEALPKKEAPDKEKLSEQQAEELHAGLRSALAPTAVAIAVLWMLKMVQQVTQLSHHFGGSRCLQ